MILLIILIFPGSVAYSATKQITIGTSSPSGAWMMLASTIAKLINDNFNDVNVTPVPSPRGSTENIETIVSGEREMGFAMANVAAAVAAGTAPFTRSEENINGWFAAHYGQWYLLAREDSGIKTFEDLKGKRIGIGLPGDGDESLNKDIFPLIGLKWDDFTPESCGLSEAIELVKQNQIDVISYVGAPRLPMFTELMSAKKMRLVALSPEQVEKISGEIPYLVQREMPQSDFPQLVMDTEKAPIFTMNHVMLCSKNIAEEDMYRYTKLFFENITTIHEANPAFAVITLENAVKGMPIKFHPGAEKYYKEKGVMQ
jgi:TRAP transporter TAXI family solute receptor